MPKGEKKKDIIDREAFEKVLHEKEMSIRKIGDLDNYICSEKTIRRALKEGKISPDYLDAIAKHLDVDPRYLSGEIQNKLREHNCDTTRLHSRMFPYFQKLIDDNSISKFWESFLLLFAISKEQFDEMDFEKQYAFQHEVFESMISIINRYFDKDGFGDEKLIYSEKVLLDLESYHDLYYENLYADQILRPEFISNPPKGYTKIQIKKMSQADLLSLDNYLNRNLEE